MAVTEGTDELTIDFDSITLGELDDLEGVLGPGLVDELNRGRPSTRTLIGLVWVVKRRTDPAFTFEMARDVPVSMLRREATNGAAPLPSDGPGNGPGSASPPA